MHTYVYLQSYEIKLPSQAFLDGRSLPRRKLRQVGCYDVGFLNPKMAIEGNLISQFCVFGFIPNSYKKS